VARPKVYQTSAIVLRHRKLGETDRILTLYSPVYGKFDAVAKGVRKTTSRMGGHLEVLNYVNLLVAAGQNLDIVTQAQTIEGLPAIGEDLERLSRGLYLAELVDRFTDMHEENSELFHFLHENLRRLNTHDQLDLVVHYFELGLLGVVGYRPQLSHCVNCESALTPGQNYWTASGGGILCPSCQAHEAIVRPLSLNALKVLRHMQRSSFADVAKVHIGPSLMSEIDRCLREQIRFLLERDLRSVAFLDEMRHDAKVRDDLARRQIPTAV
jgi:DNA repair protein RecO (recombination protein O)